MPEAIVGCAFVASLQDFVRFFGFLELRFRSRIVIRVAVRVMLHGQTTIRLLDLVADADFETPKYLVIVAFGHIFSNNKGAASGALS